jgi:DNA-binding response OmpR family regulator
MVDNDKYKVLIVDDNPENLKVIASALSLRNFSLTLSRSGAEALACVDRFSPDAILLDIVMPEMNGFDTCRRLKNIPSCREVPVIFLTARNDQSDIIEGFKAGGADFISKPFNREELVHRVDVHAHRFRLQQQLQKRNDALMEEACLRKKREMQLSAAERAKIAMRIAAGISHHFNNMFQTVLGYTELIENTVDTNSEIRRHTRQIIEATTKTRKIVDQLANFLVDSPGETLSVSLSRVFEEIELAFAAIIPQKVVLTYGVARNCPEIIINRNDIVQAISNIVMNSIEAIPEEGGQINMTASLVAGRSFADMLEKIDVEGNYVEIAITDNGIGMEKSVLERACDPFFTTASSSADRNGLGLSVVQGVMHANDGFLLITSEIGSGTTVKLLLPVR